MGARFDTAPHLPIDYVALRADAVSLPMTKTEML
jgi:hypothetical protein